MMNNIMAESIDKIRFAYLLTLAKSFVYVVTIVTLFVAIVPLSPVMPLVGLDPSWIFSMNKVVEQNLSIGKEIIFTFGPYASIYTQSYHPATDNLMVIGSLLLGLSYTIAVLYMAKSRNISWLLIFTVFMTLIAGKKGHVFAMVYRDALLFSYPLILSVCATHLVQHTQYSKLSLNPLRVIMVFLLSVPLGFLPLIKGGLLVLCGAMALTISSYFYYHHFRRLALIVLLCPVASAAIFWVVSGQSIINLPSFFVNMVEIIRGYTEAMSVHSSITEIGAYLLAGSALVWALARSEKITLSAKLFLGINLIFYLFVSFKAGFVRHDFHSITALTSIAFASLILRNVCSNKSIITVFIGVISLFFVFYTVLDPQLREDVRNKFGYNIASKSEKWREIFFFTAKRAINKLPRNAYTHIRNTYTDSWYGMRSRILESNALQMRFELSLVEIRKKCALPLLLGTTDIYSWDQSCLLSSNNKWNPRPIFQSFSAYTPKLAKLNEQHLRNSDAPDNVLFQVQTIDGRLPSLDDGLSWPALLDNYTVINLDDDLAYLRKRKTIKAHSTYDVIDKGIHKIGDDVLLPQAAFPIYAEIDLKPTLLGKFVSLVFKPPPLKLRLNLKDGTSKDYLVISSMMQTGFFISPLVQSTKDFILIASMNPLYLKNNIVESMTIAPYYGGSILWSSTYTLKLSAYKGRMATTIPIHQLVE